MLNYKLMLNDLFVLFVATVLCGFIVVVLGVAFMMFCDLITWVLKCF